MARRCLFLFLILLVLFSGNLFANDFVYRTLSNSDRVIYDRIGEAILHCEPEIKNLPISGDDCLRLYSDYLDDHPGIFWVTNGIRYRTTNKSSGAPSTTMSLEYTHQENLQQDQKTFVQMVSKFHEYIKDDPNDWLKLYHIYDYLAKSITYDNNYMDQTMWSVFFNGIGVCAGFARSFQYLALLEGIPCIIVTGYQRNADGTPDSVRHAWCMAKIEGKWYHFDPTWGVKDQNGNTDFTYFCRSQKRMELTHVIDNKYPLPEAEDDSLSYINMRHRYMGTYSRDRYRDIFLKAYGNKELCITVEFNSPEELSAARSDLIAKGGLSTLIKEAGISDIVSFSYVANDRSYALKISLKKK